MSTYHNASYHIEGPLKFEVTQPTVGGATAFAVDGDFDHVTFFADRDVIEHQLRSALAQLTSLPVPDVDFDMVEALQLGEGDVISFDGSTRVTVTSAESDPIDFTVHVAWRDADGRPTQPIAIPHRDAIRRYRPRVHSLDGIADEPTAEVA